MKLIRTILFTQGLYLILTAMWPFVSMESFLLVTGQKYDLRLVYTVSLVLLPIGLLLFIKAWCFNGLWDSLFLVGFLSAGGLAIADLYFSFRGIVSFVYAIDGVFQLVFLLLWSIAIIRYHTYLIYLAGSWKT